MARKKMTVHVNGERSTFDMSFSLDKSAEAVFTISETRCESLMRERNGLFVLFVGENSCCVYWLGKKGKTFTQLRNYRMEMRTDEKNI